jgi:hypothetical protein
MKNEHNEHNKNNENNEDIPDKDNQNPSYSSYTDLDILDMSRFESVTDYKNSAIDFIRFDNLDYNFDYYKNKFPLFSDAVICMLVDIAKEEYIDLSTKKEPPTRFKDFKVTDGTYILDFK